MILQGGNNSPLDSLRGEKEKSTMARINEKLVYPQGKLFVRRDPANISQWQVVNGKWITEGGKRVGFDLQTVLETGIAKGKIARERATAIELKAAADVTTTELAVG